MMKASALKPGDVFRVTPRDPEWPLRVCKTNDFRNGIRWGWPAPANTLYWCFMGADVDVELVDVELVAPPAVAYAAQKFGNMTADDIASTWRKVSAEQWARIATNLVQDEVWALDALTGYDWRDAFAAEMVRLCKDGAK